MIKRMSDWRKANPDKTVMISFHKEMVIIGTMRQALEARLIQVNEHGYDMIKTMCEPEKEEPTVIMFRLAMEMPEEKE